MSKKEAVVPLTPKALCVVQPGVQQCFAGAIEMLIQQLLS